MEREAKFLDRSFAVLSRWTRALKTPRGSRASDPASALALAHGVAIGEVISALPFAHLLAILGVVDLVTVLDRL